MVLPALLLCFYADFYPQGGLEETCVRTDREVDTVKEWGADVALDRYHDRPGYMEAGYRNGAEFVVLYRGYYAARSPEPGGGRTHVVIDTDVVFASGAESPSAVHTAWSDWQ